MEKLYLTKLMRFGTGHCFIMPQELKRALEIERGDYVTMAAYDEGVVLIKKVTDAELRALKPKYIKYGT